MKIDHSDLPGQHGAAKTFTLGILEAGDNRADLIAEHGTYSDWFEDLLSTGSDRHFTYRRYPTHAGALPASAQECDGYLMTGSRFSVTEQASWMQAAKDFIRQASIVKPIIGVCFGHQLIADAFGGRVAPALDGWVVGVHDFEVGRQKPWMKPGRSQVSLVSSNCDQVTEPPDTAEVLAGSTECPIGMMQIGANVLTVQTHPEAPKPLIEIIYRYRAEQIGKTKTEAAITSLAKPTDSAVVARWFREFLVR